ncbi:MAG TPA: hypothetical protein VEU97_17750 [Ktedonobacteraceae bacterium]|nr:hypothetical protein [Ktedonobacteraceae bacterium]
MMSCNEKVAEHAEEIARELSHAENIPVNVVFKPVLTDPEAIRAPAHTI